MSNLTDFLLARITEDEAMARAAVDLRERVYVGEMEATEHHYSWTWLTRFRSNGPWSSQMLDGCSSPDRVLVECEAKRRIVVLHGEADEPGFSASPDYWAGTAHLDEVLELLALPYADHPDYRQEWKP